MLLVQTFLSVGKMVVGIPSGISESECRVGEQLVGDGIEVVGMPFEVWVDTFLEKVEPVGIADEVGTSELLLVVSCPMRHAK